MATRIITIAREFGSGGASIAAMLAERLGWRLLDSAFVSEVARAAHVDPEMVRSCDERIDTWFHRISKRALWRGSFEQVSSVTDRDFFDAETMVALSSELIQQAAEKGNCIIVGRGAQCVLQRRPETFHVFVYAPMKLKLERVRARVENQSNLERYICDMDRRRKEWVQTHFKCTWNNPHLYDLMLCSAMGDERAVATILQAAGLLIPSPSEPRIAAA